MRGTREVDPWSAIGSSPHLDGDARVRGPAARERNAMGNRERVRWLERRLHRSASGHKPFLTVRSKIPSVARRADSGTIGKCSLMSSPIFDQS